ncbi:MAG TPA: alkaline phosphatase family protein [Elusimicrobiota bacterium]|nr:alkaline phosphatase family protein [Elusimicrobiota bacterium]
MTTRIKRRLFARLAACAAVLVLAAPEGFGAAAPKAANRPRFKRMMIVIFENTDFKAALAQPAFADMARRGALLTNYYAVTHPSLPNYVALIAGGLRGVHSDADASAPGRNIGDLLEAAGKSWKVYAEDYPGGCDLKSRAGPYARKHVPFLNFAEVQKNPAACVRVVPAKDLGADIRLGRLPDYSLYIPDLNDDGHDTDAAYAAGWFAGRFGPLLKTPKFIKGMLLVLTFDEDSQGLDDGGKGLNHNRVYTVLYGGMVRPGAVSAGHYTHYSLLRLAEDNWGLGRLDAGDAGARPISGIWK